MGSHNPGYGLVHGRLSNARSLLLLLVVVAAALATVVVLVGEAEEADAWSTSTRRAEYDSYRSGYVYSTSSKYESSGPYCSYGYYSSEERAWLGFPIDSFSDDAYVDSITFRFRVNYVTSTATKSIYARLLYFNPMYADTRTIYYGISSDANYLGALSITGTGDYTLTVSSGDMNDFRNILADDDDYLFIGFEAMSHGYRTQFYYYYSYMYIYYDASPPTPPRLDSLSRYTGSSSVTLTFSGGSDNPSGGNRGLAYYGHQIGAFRYSGDDQPLFATAWFYYGYTSYGISNLADGQMYYFRIRSRDNSGFTSSWASSGYVYTTIDTSPPTVPVIEPEPEFTAGSSNIVQWSASTDAGYGMWRYEVQWSTRPDFAGASTTQRTGTSMTYTGLSSGTTYYYRVRALDNFRFASAWSVPTSTTMDSAAPSTPELVAEPVYTPGTENTFNWNPAVDTGVGVAGYRFQLSTSIAFLPGTILKDVNTDQTYVLCDRLASGRAYFARVNAVDHFGYVSAWSPLVSSVQDADGPSLPGIHGLPTYHANTSIHVSWDPAVDYGVGLGWYELGWADEPTFTVNLTVWDRVLGTTFTVPPLDENKTWWFYVMAYDLFGNPSGSTTTNTTVDGTPPTAPAVDAEPGFTPGTTNTISWQPSTDSLSGVDHYAVRVYARADGGLVFTDDTDLTSMDVSGLADGSTYWYEVVAVDAAGNANASAMVHSTQDATPPTIPNLMPMPEVSPGTSKDVEWSASLDAGSMGVEYLLEWALDADFSVGLGDTGWIAETMHSATSLTDGATYFFRVKARDALGHESLFGMGAHTTMDASPPPVPTMEEVSEFVPGPVVPVSWLPVVDGSGLPVEYQAMVYEVGSMSGLPIETSPWLDGTGFDFVGLPSDVLLEFRVVARDALGWTSEPSTDVNLTIDGTGPTAAVIHESPEYVGGGVVSLSWDAAVDAGVGGVTHRLVAYSDEAMTTRVFATEWTGATAGDAFGLAPNVPHWFVVESMDAFGNHGNSSEPVEVTIDGIHPVLFDPAKAIFGPSDEAVAGKCSDVGSGVDSVEYSVDGGQTWLDATLEGEDWSVDMDDIPTGTTEVWVRAIDGVGNHAEEYMTCLLDREDPVVGIDMPTEGSDVSGAVIIMGSVSDAHLVSYTVEYKTSTGSEWSEVQPEQHTTGVAGVLATWVTSGLAGGNYELRVTAKDAVEQSASATVAVVLKGAHLAIGPGDISFSDSHPLPGDKVTVLVTVRNTGDSPAEDVTVSLMDKGTQVGTQSGVTVPANGVATVAFELEAKGDHELTAKASSDLYDTGAMDTGQPLQTIEEEAALENAGGILGLLGVILAVIAILLVLLVGRRGGAAPEGPSAPADDVLVDPILEEPASVEPQPLPTAEPMSPPQGQGGDADVAQQPQQPQQPQGYNRFDNRPPR